MGVQATGMKGGLIFVLSLSLMLGGSVARAQANPFWTILVKVGEAMVNLVVEKRADLVVGVVSGTIVDIGDKTISAALASAHAGELPKTCSTLSLDVASCPTRIHFNSESEHPATKEDVNQALMEVQRTIMLEKKTEPMPAVLSQPQPVAPSISPQQQEQLIDMTYWWSIQSSSFVADYQGYLNRFPNGEFRAIAQSRIAQLQPSLPTPPASGSPCSATNRAALNPVLGIFDAINKKDLQQYASQWFTDSFYSSYDGSVRQSYGDRMQNRQKAFANWQSAHIQMLQYRVDFENSVTAVIRDTYDMTIVFWSGRSYHEQQLEAYEVACSNDGYWRVVQNVDYLQ